MNGNEYVVSEASMDKDKLVKILSIVAGLIGSVVKLVPNFAYGDKLVNAVNYLVAQDWFINLIMESLTLLDKNPNPTKADFLSHVSK